MTNIICDKKNVIQKYYGCIPGDETERSINFIAHQTSIVDNAMNFVLSFYIPYNPDNSNRNICISNYLPTKSNVNKKIVS